MKRLMIIILMLWIGNVFAAEDYYPFGNDLQKQQFNQLTTHLRCLVCQNQTIAESNAGLASDLRGQIYIRIKQGQSTEEIVDFLVSRYGEYILYQPPFQSNTVVLWLLPFALLMSGVSYLFYYIRRKRISC